MIEVDISDLKTLEFIPEDEREDGISLIVRVRNGEDFLRIAIESAIDQVDEIIVVFNESIDRTEEVLLELEEKYPEKIHLYKYLPFVYPPHDNYYRSGRVKSTDPHALSHYYNFALSKTRFSHVCKHDDDNLVFPNVFRRLKNEVVKRNNSITIGLRGINLFDLNNKIYVNKSSPETHGKDTLVFKYNEETRYVQAAQFEVFDCKQKTLWVETCFYHLKYCKRDRGLNNYNLNRNTRSRYVGIFKDMFKNTNLVPLNEYIKGKNYPNPFDLGFEFITDGEKTYDVEEFRTLEKSIRDRYTEDEIEDFALDTE